MSGEVVRMLCQCMQTSRNFMRSSRSRFWKTCVRIASGRRPLPTFEGIRTMLGRRVVFGDSFNGDVESVDPPLLGRSGEEADSHVLGGEGVRITSRDEFGGISI